MYHHPQHHLDQDSTRIQPYQLLAKLPHDPPLGLSRHGISTHHTIPVPSAGVFWWRQLYLRYSWIRGMRRTSWSDFHVLQPNRRHPRQASLCARETVECRYIYWLSALFLKEISTLQLGVPRYYRWVYTPENEMRVLQCNERLAVMRSVVLQGLRPYTPKTSLASFCRWGLNPYRQQLETLRIEDYYWKKLTTLAVWWGITQFQRGILLRILSRILQ